MPGQSTTSAQVSNGPTTSEPPGQPDPTAAARRLPTAYALTLVVAGLMAAVSAAGLLLGPRLYGADPTAAGGITGSTAGIVVPGFLAHDSFNAIVALPLLLATARLAHRGALFGLLLWPGALFYVLYTYAQYLIGAPFGPLFLPYVLLVVVGAYTTMVLVTGIDGEAIRARLAGAVPARAAGGVLIALALLTIGQDASGAIAAALAVGSVAEPIARHVWIADLAIEAPAVLVGGVLLWRRAALGYVAGAGLLFQFGLTPLALAVIAVLRPWLSGTPPDAAIVAGLLIFVAVAYVPLAFFARGALAPRTVGAPRAARVLREG